MQVLCIENATIRPEIVPFLSFIPKKGDICNAYKTEPKGLIWAGIDMWHNLEEFKDPREAAHVCLFIDLPSQEGQSFRKEETVEIPHKLQPFYEQL